MPLTVNNLMRVASAFKLITSIAAMQCEQRQLVGLDDDVEAFIPDLQGIRLLTGYDDEDKPILAAPKKKITLRFALHSIRELLSKLQNTRLTIAARGII